MQAKTAELPFKEYSSLSDIELMEFVALQDDDTKVAFTALVDRYKGYVWTIISRKLKGYTSTEAFEDLLHEVFLRVLQKAETFGKGVANPNFKSWVGTITKNLINNWFSDFQFTEELDETCYEIEQPNPYEDTEERRLFFEALDLLSERDKEIMTLYYETHNPRNPQSKTPRAMLQVIYKKFDISNETVRNVRRNSKKKIQDYVQYFVED